MRSCSLGVVFTFVVVGVAVRGRCTQHLSEGGTRAARARYGRAEKGRPGQPGTLELLNLELLNTRRRFSGSQVEGLELLNKGLLTPPHTPGIS